ncbi:MAG: transporter substrate-binding domain-containing protein [Desulfobacter sp.]|nr:MAG: transporter substrate-binding domain-containing protein [Desulfobacter sp.]
MERKYFIFLALIICILFSSFVHGAEQKHLNINCTIHSPYEAFFFRLVEEICARNQITVSRNTPPVGRSLIHVNSGIDDGDGPRVMGLSKSYPNLVCVTEPFGEFVFGAFARKENIRIDGWSSLKDLNLAYIHGWKIFDNEVTAAKSITKVKNKTLLFNLLAADRTDIILITKLCGYAMIQKLGIEGVRFVEPPLAVVPNYLYLHKSHEKLASTLSLTLKEVKQDGTYKQLYAEMIIPYLPN